MENSIQEIVRKYTNETMQVTSRKLLQADGSKEDIYKMSNQMTGKIYRNQIQQTKDFADVPLNAAFCNACVSKVNCVEIIMKSTEEGCICPTCHTVVEKGNLFCNHCGTKIESTNE